MLSQTGPTSTHGATLALLHNPLAVRTVQLGTVRLLVGALHVTVRTFAGVAPLGTPDLAVGQHRGEVVQGSAGLCNEVELLGQLPGQLPGQPGDNEILLRQVGQQWPGAGGSGWAQEGLGQLTGEQSTFPS